MVTEGKKARKEPGVQKPEKIWNLQNQIRVMIEVWYEANKQD